MENETKIKYNSASLFLITVGVVMMNIIIFGFIGRYLGRLLWSVDVQQLMIQMKEGNYDMSAANSKALLLTQVTTQIGGFLLSVLLIIQIMKRRFAEFTKLHVRPSLLWTGLALLLFICFAPILEHIVAWNANLGIPESLDKIVKPSHELNQKVYELMLFFNDGPRLFVNLFAMALVPAFCEELLFRGLLLRIFRSMWGNIHLAIILSSVLFAIIHLQVYNIVPMIALAILFGYTYYLTGSLWVAMLLHFINNASVVVMLHLGVDTDSVGSTLPIALTMFAAAIVVFIYMFKKSPKTNTLSLD